MYTSFINLFFKLVFHKKVVSRGLKVALIVGIILNLINQGEAIISLSYGEINYMKFFLTFLVPYAVSSYSSAMAKMHFEVGEIAPMNAVLKCIGCEDETYNLNKEQQNGK